MNAPTKTPPAADGNPEIGRTITAMGLKTNVHDVGEGAPVVMIHGSGPGVSAFANWRLNMPALAEGRRVVALDCVGFGYTDRAEDGVYSQDLWVRHILAVMDELGSSAPTSSATPLAAAWRWRWRSTTRTGCAASC